MATTTNNILLPYLEDTGLDGKKLYTPKEWTERMRHYIKRIHDIDIKPALSGETMPTNNGWTEKTHNKTRFHLGSRTIRDRNNLKRRIQHRSRHDQHWKINTAIQRLLHAETQHLPEPRRLLLGKTGRKWNTGRPLAETRITRKRLRIQRYQTGRPTNIKIHYHHYRQETTGNTNPRKNIESKNHRGFSNPRQLRQET